MHERFRRVENCMLHLMHKMCYFVYGNSEICAINGQMVDGRHLLQVQLMGKWWMEGIFCNILAFFHFQVLTDNDNGR